MHNPQICTTLSLSVRQELAKRLIGLKLLKMEYFDKIVDTYTCQHCLTTGSSFKKCLFGIAYPGMFHLVGRSVAFFFFNIYYSHMDGNGKKKKISDFFE